MRLLVGPAVPQSLLVGRLDSRRVVPIVAAEVPLLLDCIALPACFSVVWMLVGALPPRQQEPRDEVAAEVATLLGAEDPSANLERLIELRKQHATHPAVLLGLAYVFASEGPKKRIQRAQQTLDELLALPPSAAVRPTLLARARALRQALARGERIYVACSKPSLRTEAKRTASALSRMRRIADAADRRAKKAQEAIDRFSLRTDVRSIRRLGKARRALEAARAKAAPVLLPKLIAEERLRRTEARLGKQVKTPITHGLDWLAKTQRADGAWLADPKAKKKEHPKGGPLHNGKDIGVTGLATLTLMAGSIDWRHGPHAKNIRRALAFLAKQQTAKNGRIGPAPAMNAVHYGHAIATIALAHAIRAQPDPNTERCVRRAVRYIENSPGVQGGWRYVPHGDSDASVTGWMLLALVAARDAGVATNPNRTRTAVRWLSTITSNDGSVGYVKRGQGSSRLLHYETRFPAELTVALAAISLRARTRVRPASLHEELARRATKLILAHPPLWDEGRGTIDLYYWLHATHALSLVGGDAWKTWQKAIVAALSSHAKDDGSWPLAGPWCDEGGPVYATSACLLMLLTAAEANSLPMD